MRVESSKGCEIERHGQTWEDGTRVAIAADFCRTHGVIIDTDQPCPQRSSSGLLDHYHDEAECNPEEG